jgi:hypothetical protein
MLWATGLRFYDPGAVLDWLVAAALLVVSVVINGDQEHGAADVQMRHCAGMSAWRCWR